MNLHRRHPDGTHANVRASPSVDFMKTEGCGKKRLPLVPCLEPSGRLLLTTRKRSGYRIGTKVLAEVREMALPRFARTKMGISVSGGTVEMAIILERIHTGWCSE